MYCETPEYFRLKSIYGKKVAERYKNLTRSPQYRTTEDDVEQVLRKKEWEERRGRPLLLSKKQNNLSLVV
jgi:hypothetical protein